MARHAVKALSYTLEATASCTPSVIAPERWRASTRSRRARGPVPSPARPGSVRGAAGARHRHIFTVNQEAALALGGMSPQRAERCLREA